VQKIIIVLVLLLVPSICFGQSLVERKLLKLCGEIGPQYAPLIVFNAKQFKIPALVLTTNIALESRCRADVVSKKGAVGLGQILPNGNANMGYTKEELKIPEINIFLTARHLRRMYKICKSWPKAIAMYNGIPGCVETNWGKYVAKTS
jgi:soluble lytic murein transglycosylase-like protein